jgi:arabinoxylan arabinofuranohydrolase
MHKRNDIYYFSYSDDFEVSGADIAYMTSSSPTAGFQYQGIILPSPPDNMGNNNHASIFEFENEWYIAYHSRNIANGDYLKRSPNLARLHYNTDGTIVRVTPTGAGVPQVRYGNPYQIVQAETLDRQSGIQTVRTGPGEVYVGFIQHGDWTQFTGFDFAGGATEVEFRVASDTAGGQIELRIGNANGALAGTCDVSGTGGWESWQAVRCPVTGLNGIQTVVFRYIGGDDFLFNIDWYRFISPDISDTDSDTEAGTGTDNDGTASDSGNSADSDLARDSGSTTGDDTESDRNIEDGVTTSDTGCSCHSIGHTDRINLASFLSLLLGF